MRFVDMASERSCSVTRSERIVVPRYYSFVKILGGSGATCPPLDAGAVLMQHYSQWFGVQNRGSTTVNKIFYFCQTIFAALFKWCP